MHGWFCYLLLCIREADVVQNCEWMTKPRPQRSAREIDHPLVNEQNGARNVCSENTENTCVAGS